MAVAPVVLFRRDARPPQTSRTGRTRRRSLTAATLRSDAPGERASLIGFGFALLAPAFVAVGSYLRDAADQRSSFSRSLIVFGCALLPILTGMEFTLLAAVETGGDAEAAQRELMPWFVPVALGRRNQLCTRRSRIRARDRAQPCAGSRLTRLVAGALVVMAAARFVPLGAGQYVIGLAG